MRECKKGEEGVGRGLIARREEYLEEIEVRGILRRNCAVLVILLLLPCTAFTYLRTTLIVRIKAPDK